MAEGPAGNRAAGNKRFRASEYGVDENYRHQSKKLFQSNDDNPGVHQRQDAHRTCFSTDYCTSAPDCPEIYRENQERWPQAQWLPDKAGVVAISRESTGAANGEVEYQWDDLYLQSQNLWLFGDSEEGLEVLEPNPIAVQYLQYDAADLEIPSPPTSLTSFGDYSSLAVNSFIPSAAVTAETSQPHATSAETGIAICYGTVRTFSVRYLSQLTKLSQLTDIDILLFAGVNGSSAASSESDAASLALRFGTSAVTAVRNGLEIGVVNKLDARRLRELKYAFTITLKPSINFQDGSKAKKGQSRTVLRMDVDLFGASPIVDQVGEFLSDRRMFLQEPQCLSPHTLYQNPHVFSVNVEGKTMLFAKENLVQNLDFDQEIENMVNSSKPIEEACQIIELREIKTCLQP